MKKIYVKISRPGMGGYIESQENWRNSVQTEIETAIECQSVGDKLVIELIEMEEDDFNGLREFVGW